MMKTITITDRRKAYFDPSPSKYDGPNPGEIIKGPFTREFVDHIYRSLAEGHPARGILEGMLK